MEASVQQWQNYSTDECTDLHPHGFWLLEMSIYLHKIQFQEPKTKMWLYPALQQGNIRI